MQKTYVKIVSRKTFTAGILKNSSAPDSSAQISTSNSNMEIVSSNIQSSVEFKGAIDKIFLFDVKVENPDAETFTLEIQNDNGATLYSQNYFDTNLLKEIKLSNEELAAHYNFTVRINSREPEQNFVVSITTESADAVQAA